MPPKKKATTKKSKTTKKGTAKPKKTNQKKQPATSSNKAGYMLIILVLITALVVLFNKKYSLKPILKNIKEITSGKKTPKKNKKENIDTYSLNDEINKNTDKTQNENLKDEYITLNLSDDKNELLQASSQKIKIYFVKVHPKTQQMHLTYVKRTVSSKGKLKQALQKLIVGPSAYEDKKGIYTAIPKNLKIRKITIRNKTAILDFNKAIEYGATGAILLKRLDQIIYTATQFESINSIVLLINGKRKNTLGSDGISISGYLRRK